ncbi:MAG: DUF4279 domain-containing protein [Vulcanimicrobiota bacterium]
MRKPTDSRLTQPDINYASCERTHATLCINCGDYHPDIISEELRLEPTDVSIKGRSRTNSRNRTRIEKYNIWFLCSESFVESLDLRHHLDWLLSNLIPRKEKLSALQQKVEFLTYVRCVWWSKGSGGPTLWPEQMTGLAELNLECAFDVYFFEEDNSEILLLRIADDVPNF